MGKRYRIDLLKDHIFRKLLARWLRRAVVIRLPTGLAWKLFRIPGGRKWAEYRALAEAAISHLHLHPSPVSLIPGLEEGRPQAKTRCEKFLSDMPKTIVHLSEAAVLVRNPGPLRDKKVALMAHWDPDGVLDPYVRYYIDQLQRLGFVVILATDRDLALGPGDAPGMPNGITKRACTGYDFTSWKAAFELLPDLFETEALLLCNDSVFAPVGDMGHLLAVMENIVCDFWGMTESVQYKPHLPSYFLFLRRRAVEHPALKNFFARVDTNPSPRNAVRYELNLSLWLTSHGLTPGAALPQVMHGINESPVHHAWRPCIEAGLPIIKRNLLVGNPVNQDLRQAPAVMDTMGYPLNLVQGYFERRGIFSGLHFGPRGQGGVSVVMIVTPDADLTALATVLKALADQTMREWELIATCVSGVPKTLSEFAARDERVHLVRLPQDISSFQFFKTLRSALAHARRENVTFLQPDETNALPTSESLQGRLVALNEGASVVLCSPLMPRGLYDLFPAILAEDPGNSLSGLLLRKDMLCGLDWNLPEGSRPFWWVLGQLCLDGPVMCLPTGENASPPIPLEPSLSFALGKALVVRTGRRHDLHALFRLSRVALRGSVSAAWLPCR